MAQQEGDPPGNRPRANHDHGGRETHSNVRHADSGDDEDDENADSDDDGSSDQKDNAQKGDDQDRDDGGDDKPSLFRRPLFWIILLVVVVVLVVGGFLYWRHARQYESTDDAFVDAHIVRLAPEVGGRLVAVADVDNRQVRAGRLLAVIEPNGRESQLGEARANVQQAQAQYRQALAQIEVAVAAALQARAQARAPQADAAKARADLNRYEALLRLDPAAVAGQQLDQARAAYRSAAAQAAAAREGVDNALAQVNVARRAAAAVATTIEARRAAEQQAQTIINDLRLVAPVSGQVTNRQVSVGSYVAPGTQVMAIVPDRLWVTANFKETQLTLMRIGQPVEIRIDAFPNVKFRGHIDSFQRAAGQSFAVLPPQNATGNFVKVVQRVPVRIEFDLGKDEKGQDLPNPRRFPIGPGMSAVPTVKVR